MITNKFSVILMIWCLFGQIMVYSQYKCNYFSKDLPDDFFRQQVVYYDPSTSVYMFGGRTTGPAQYHHAVWKWNTSDQNGWFIQIPDSNVSTKFFVSTVNSVAVINSNAYFVGIDVHINSELGKVFVFSLEDERWLDASNIAPLPAPITSACVAGNSTHIFVVGGFYNSRGSSPILYIYSVVENKWFSENIDISPGVSFWSSQFCYMLDNTLFVFGGRYSDGSYTETDDGIYRYQNTVWTKIGTLPYPVFSGVAIYYIPYIYLVGGITSTKSTERRILVFDPVEEILTHYTYTARNALQNCGAAAVNNVIYTFGGEAVGFHDKTEYCNIQT